MERLKALIILALAVTGFIFINGYIQPIKGSAQETLSNSEQLTENINNQETPSNSEQLTENINNVDLNTEFHLKFGQIAFIRSEELGIKFLNVTEDSRCPSDVQCIRAGVVTIELEILKDGVTIDYLSLTNGEGREDLVTDFDGYSIRLVGVDPYPKTTVTREISDYVATLIVSKRE